MTSSLPPNPPISPNPSPPTPTLTSERASQQTLASEANPWSVHWRSTDAPSVGASGDADPIAMAVAQHWQDQAEWLSSMLSVVDVGSGPAVLARSVSEARRSLGFQGPVAQWHCIDQADISPTTLSLPGIQVLPMPQTDFASLAPYEEGVDAVVSQFGLEYVNQDRPDLARRIRRWLLPGGRLHAVMHARDSVIAQTSARHVEALRFALDEWRLVASALDVVEALATLPADPTERMMHGVEERDRYNAAVNAAKRYMEASGERSAVLMELLHTLTDAIRAAAQGQVDSARQRMMERAHLAQAERSRLQQMLAVSLDEPDLQVWCQALTEAGFHGARAEKLQCPIGPVAWVLQAHLPG